MEKDYHSDNKAFVMYKEWEQYFSALDSIEDAGRLIKALFAYAARNEEPDFSGNLKMAFMFMKNRIDEDGKKWERKCAANSENSKKRWEKRNSAEDTDTPASSDTDNTNDDTSSNKIKNENTKEISIKEISDKIYSKYPRKDGKAKGYEYIAAFLTKGRKLSGIGRVKLNHEQIYCAVKDYAMDCEENQTAKQYIQQFSTFMDKTVLDYVDKSIEGYERYMEGTYGDDWKSIKFIYK